MRNIIFDLDGTIVDLYGIEEWERKLNSADVTPYEQAKPLCDLELLRSCLLSLNDVRIVIVSWGAIGASQESMSHIRTAKIEWLHRWKFPFDEVHIVKYGTDKYSTIQYKHEESYLFDDSQKIRNKFKKRENCYAYSEKEIFTVLEELRNG